MNAEAVHFSEPITKDSAAPVAVKSAVVVHLSTGDIVVTTYIDGTYTVKVDPVAMSKNVE